MACDYSFDKCSDVAALYSVRMYRQLFTICQSRTIIEEAMRFQIATGVGVR